MVSGMVVENMNNLEMISELNAICKGLTAIAADASKKNKFNDDRPVELEIISDRLKDLAENIRYYNTKTKLSSLYDSIVNNREE